MRDSLQGEVANAFQHRPDILCVSRSKDAKLLKTLKFPKEYDLKVDLKKVNWEVMKGWVAKRITELLGLEDEVVIGYVLEQLDNKEVRS